MGASIERFNAADGGQVRDWLTACLDVPRWVDDVAGARPYADADALVERARAAAQPLTEDEVDRALSHHPRIGEKAAGTGGASAAMSAEEQSGVDPADADVAAALAEGNAAYEQRFGHVFLIRAAGRSAREVLDTLDHRLQRTPEQERATTAEQLREIALLRLEGVLAA